MIITPDMPKTPGYTVEEAGRLSDIMDVEGWDNVGVKIRNERDCVSIEVGAGTFPSKVVVVDAEDACYLAGLLLRAAVNATAPDSGPVIDHAVTEAIARIQATVTEESVIHRLRQRG